LITLVHGSDNVNDIDPEKLKIFPRTDGISSTDIRIRAQKAITDQSNHKLMLTPGPAVLLHENIQHLKPVFGRGDQEYLSIAESVSDWIRSLSGQDELIMAQGSARFALELAAHSFVFGKVLIVSTGYYSDRLIKLLPKGCQVTMCDYEDMETESGNFDWVMCAYTETSTAFKI
jgi:Serine-pyruvate aminotransferase/archaeal aspartate aminotransferase